GGLDARDPLEPRARAETDRGRARPRQGGRTDLVLRRDGLREAASAGVRLGARAARSGGGVDGRRQRRPRPARGGGARDPGGARPATRPARAPVCRFPRRCRAVPGGGGGRVSDLLGEQKRYYAERAEEYDDWWYRRGRYELEPDALARWEADIAEADAALEEFTQRGSVLEPAAGTGIWTRKLVRRADRVVAVDANAETLVLNTRDAELVRADVFGWRPSGRFDLVFFSFWLSHVPEERFDEFWGLVRAALVPG